MINTNELMFGNFVLYKNNPIEVEGITKNSICFFENKIGVRKGILCKPNEIEPIPIIEEILEKCGFYKCENLQDNWFINDFDDKIFQLNGDKSDEYKLIGMDMSFKYLHELQNIYFLYRKERIEINL